MAVEYRFAALEFRSDGSVIEGVAMRYGDVARIWDAFDESVEAGAFKFDDVILNRMHMRSDPIARTGGGGLELSDSAARLSIRADVPEYRADVRDMVKRGILRGLSVEIDVLAEEWPSPSRASSAPPRCRGSGLSTGRLTATRPPPLRKGRKSAGRKRGSSPWWSERSSPMG